MKIYSSSNTFEGYKNLIVRDTKVGLNNRLSLWAAELTNEGNKDLDQYRILQKKMGIDSDDVIFCLYVKNKYGQNLFLNEKPLLWGTELRNLQYKYPSNEYKKVEEMTLKAYSLLASITKQMMQDASAKIDSGYEKVFTKTLHKLTMMTENPFLSYSFLDSITRSKNSIFDIGRFFNNGIHKTMNKFLK